MKSLRVITYILLLGCAANSMFAMQGSDQKDLSTMTPEELTTLVSGEPVNPQVLHPVRVEEPLQHVQLTPEELVARVSGEPLANPELITRARPEPVLQAAPQLSFDELSRRALTALMTYLWLINAQRVQGGSVKH
jgi:hypothetical protein